jgi:uncharacterized C2H2 Zn-finger protein
MSEKKPTCAYCGSVFETNKDLSTHIDRIHGDSGVLEGSKKNY